MEVTPLSTQKLESLSRKSLPDTIKGAINDLQNLGKYLLSTEEKEKLEKLYKEIIDRNDNKPTRGEVSYVMTLARKINNANTRSEIAQLLNHINEVVKENDVTLYIQLHGPEKLFETLFDGQKEKIITYYAKELYAEMEKNGVTERLAQIHIIQSGKVLLSLQQLITRLHENHVTFGQIIRINERDGKPTATQLIELAGIHRIQSNVNKTEERIAAALLVQILQESKDNVSQVNTLRVQSEREKGNDFLINDTTGYMEELGILEAMNMILKSHMNNLETNVFTSIGDAYRSTAGGGALAFFINFSKNIDVNLANLRKAEEDTLIQYVENKYSKEGSTLIEDEKRNLRKALIVLMDKNIDQKEPIDSYLAPHTDIKLSENVKKIINAIFGDGIQESSVFHKKIKQALGKPPISKKFPNAYEEFRKHISELTVEEMLTLENGILQNNFGLGIDDGWYQNFMEKIYLHEKGTGKVPIQTLLTQFNILRLMKKWKIEGAMKAEPTVTRQIISRFEILAKNYINGNVQSSERVNYMLQYIADSNGLNSVGDSIGDMYSQMNNNIERILGIEGVIGAHILVPIILLLPVWFKIRHIRKHRISTLHAERSQLGHEDNRRRIQNLEKGTPPQSQRNEPPPEAVSEAEKRNLLQQLESDLRLLQGADNLATQKVGDAYQRVQGRKELISLITDPDLKGYAETLVQQREKSTYQGVKDMSGLRGGGRDTADSSEERREVKRTPRPIMRK